MSRFNFKKNIECDLALLRETESTNPYSVGKLKARPKWETVAESLKASNLKLDVCDRLCRERVTKLIKQFRAGEALSVKASGVEEAEMDELKTLLTSVSSLVNDMPQPANAATKKSVCRKTNSRKRAFAQETRERAVANFADILTADEVAEQEEENRILLGIGDTIDVPENEATIPTTQNALFPEAKSGERKRSTMEHPESAMVNYLKEKSEQEYKFKHDELNVRAAEARNKEIELLMQKERQDAELAEKKRINDLLFKMLENKNNAF